MKDYNLRDSYICYKTQSNLENIYDIKDYLKITQGYLKFIMDKLYHTGEILLPEKMGHLQIIGKKVKINIEEGKIKGLAPDWVKTKELWLNDEIAKNNKQLVYHFNEHSNGIRYRFFWSKRRILVPNKTLYNLTLTRTNKRTLSSMVKNNKEYLIK